MWGLFAITILAEIAVLYLPGFFFLKAIKWRLVASVVFAPLISIAAYEIVAIVYSKLGVFSCAASLFVPLLCLSLIFWFFSLVKTGKMKKPAFNFKAFFKKTFSLNVAIPLLYVTVAACVALFYFVEPLNGPASFSQESDNTAHLGYIQSFLTSGNYSPLEASFYHDVTNSNQCPSSSNDGSFYPTAWHCVAALAGSLAGSSAPISANAALFVFIVVVFPLSAYYFIERISGKNKAVVSCGSFVALAFAAFPWGMLSFGSLYPNMAAFSCVFLVVSIFINLVNSALRHEIKLFIGSLVVFLTGLLTLALLQPNAVFTVGVLLVSFCASVVYKNTSGKKTTTRFFYVICFLFLIILVWVACFKLPFMQSVVTFSWEPYTSSRQALINIITLSYAGSASQLYLAALVLVGILFCFIKRKNRWLIGSYAIACVMVFVDSTMSGGVRSLLTGFWYTDIYRVSAMAALAGIPLATFGLYAILCVFKRAVSWCARCCGIKKLNLGNYAICFFIVSLLLLFYPSFAITGVTAVNTSFGEFQMKWHDQNHAVNVCILDEDEQKFIEKVVQAVPKGSTIINIPDDGSAFSYGGYGLNVYYRRTGVGAIDSESADSKLIRLHLSEYDQNYCVQEAVEKADAKYLLVLDQGDDITGSRYWFGHYCHEDWTGIDTVTDSTPGFKVVLAEGDMRLYEIQPVK